MLIAEAPRHALQEYRCGNERANEAGRTDEVENEERSAPSIESGDTAAEPLDGVARHSPFGEGNSHCRQSLGLWVSRTPVSVEN